MSEDLCLVAPSDTESTCVLLVTLKLAETTILSSGNLVLYSYGQKSTIDRSKIHYRRAKNG